MDVGIIMYIIQIRTSHDLSLPASCPLQGYGNNKLLTYHLHDVHCTGNESELIKCSYLRVGPHNHCQGAAVGCTSMFSKVFISLATLENFHRYDM